MCHPPDPSFLPPEPVHKDLYQSGHLHIDLESYQAHRGQNFLIGFSQHDVLKILWRKENNISMVDRCLGSRDQIDY